MIKKIIVFFRPLKYLIKLFFYSPRYLYKKIYLDLKKDFYSKRLKKEFHIVWCAGLPKSGTTLIENILNNFPLVQANNSFFRVYDDSNLDHIHGISEEMFNKFPKNKLSFLKTHTHYNENYINIAHKHNAKIIVSMRDIRDVMISRYYHVINDTKHWQHNMIKDLKFKEGFIKSIREGNFIFFNTTKHKKPIDYYYEWLNNWQNYIKKKNNYLILWYEEFVTSSKIYIEKIANYLKFEHIDTDKIDLEFNAEKEFYIKQSLSENLNLIEEKTLRQGTSGNWKKILDDETLKEFYSALPGDISDIEYKS